MNCKNRLIAIALILIVSLNAGFTAFALEDDGVMPIYTGVTFVTANITVSESGLATLSSNIIVIPGYRIDGTIELRRDTGYTIGTWDISGSLSLTYSEYMFVTSGHDYYTFVSFDVYDSNDKVVDHIELSSKAYSY